MAYVIDTIGMRLTSILGLTPHAKLNALKSISEKKPGSNNGLIWLIVMIVIIGLTVVIARIVQAWKHKAEGFANWELFYSRTKKMQLDKSEVAILIRMIKLMNLDHDPYSVLTLESDFRNGARKCFEIDFDGNGSDQQKAEYDQRIDQLRAKLGFGPSPSGHGQSSSRQIRGGTNVTVTAEGIEGDFAAIVRQNETQNLGLEVDGAVSCCPGDKWQIRFTDEKIIWEFETSVVAQKDDLVFLEHADKMQFINLRKFQRVPVKQRAMVGKFMFQTNNLRAAPPNFSEATIVEMSGSGLRVRMPQVLHNGDKILVILEIKLRQIIQSVGIIRNTYTSNGIHREYGVELLGLSSNETAKLARITKQVACKNEKKTSAVWREDGVVPA